MLNKIIAEKIINHIEQEHESPFPWQYYLWKSLERVERNQKKIVEMLKKSKNIKITKE